MHTGQASAEGHAGGTGVSGPSSHGGVVGATSPGEEHTVCGEEIGGRLAVGAKGVASPGE